MLPLKLKLVNNKHLLIQWEDKTETTLSLQKMRTLCPCASCMSERAARSVSYIPVLLSNQLEVSEIEIVGNYAIKLNWKDGHSTGIYQYSQLQKYIAETIKT